MAAGTTVTADNLKQVRAAGIPIAMGTDAGNPLPLAGPSVYAEMDARQSAGMTSLEVLGRVPEMTSQIVFCLHLAYPV